MDEKEPGTDFEPIWNRFGTDGGLFWADPFFGPRVPPISQVKVWAGVRFSNLAQPVYLHRRALCGSTHAGERTKIAHLDLQTSRVFS